MMERLTKKNNGNTPYNQTEYPYLAGAGINDITNKLGKLEDIEEELRIPLEVLFKALKYGRWDWQKVEKHYIFDNHITLHYNGVCWIIGHHKTDMYGKTWALTKEELE